MIRPLMPLDHAHDALGDLVTQFRNDMLRRGVKEMSAREWAEEFRGWIDSYDFERQYKETLEFLARFDADHPVDRAANG